MLMDRIITKINRLWTGKGTVEIGQYKYTPVIEYIYVKTSYINYVRKIKGWYAEPIDEIDIDYNIQPLRELKGKPILQIFLAGSERLNTPKEKFIPYLKFSNKGYDWYCKYAKLFTNLRYDGFITCGTLDLSDCDSDIVPAILGNTCNMCSVLILNYDILNFLATSSNVHDGHRKDSYHTLHITKQEILQDRQIVVSEKSSQKVTDLMNTFDDSIRVTVANDIEKYTKKLRLLGIKPYLTFVV